MSVVAVKKHTLTCLNVFLTVHHELTTH